MAWHDGCAAAILGGCRFSLINAAYGLFDLPESLSPEKRQTQLRWKKAKPMGALRLLRSHHELFRLAVVNFLAYLAHEIYATVWVLLCNVSVLVE